MILFIELFRITVFCGFADWLLAKNTKYNLAVTKLSMVGSMTLFVYLSTKGWN